MSDLARHVIVALVFIRRGKEILLVKQKKGEQVWSLPGGVVEAGESVHQAAVREVREETGFAVLIQRLVGLYSKPSEESVAVTFEATIIGGDLRPNREEIAECKYFALDDLPQHTRDHFRQRVEDFSRGLPVAMWRSQ